MTNKPDHPARWTYALGLALLLLPTGCGMSTNNDVPATSTPKAAASQLDQAFTSANVDMRNDAKAASEALRAANYEKAIDSLQALKASQNLTYEQGMAVYNSTVSLEGRLVAAMQAGDPNAKQAYERLKKSRRE